MPKPRTAAAEPNAPQVLTAQVFAKRLATKNAELLGAFVLGIESGELSIDLEGAEEWIESTIDDWCESEQPTHEQQLKMISVLMLDMLLDELDVEEISDKEEQGDAVADTAEQVRKAVKLSAEVIQTVRSIWGIVHGKTS